MGELETLNDVDSLSTHIGNKQRELQEAIRSRETIEAERYNLMREILELQLKSKDKQIQKIEIDKALNKAKSNCSFLSIEIKRATSKFWNIKNV